jgi:hypothetical protein
MKSRLKASVCETASQQGGNLTAASADQKWELPGMKEIEITT